MEKRLTEKESIEIIGSMINKAKHNLSNGSIFYLIWGWAVLLASVLQFVAIKIYDWDLHWIFWPITMAITAVIAVLVGRREYKNHRHTTFVDNSMKYLWGGFVIFLFLVLNMGPVIGWKLTYLLLIGLYGMGTFISGGILKFRPLIIGGLLSLLLSAIGIFGREMINDFTDVLILLDISIIVSYLVPGYMLRAKKNEYAA